MPQIEDFRCVDPSRGGTLGAIVALLNEPGIPADVTVDGETPFRPPDVSARDRRIATT